MDRSLADGALVLVADDDEVVRALAVRALEKAGYRVLKTSDGLGTLRAMTHGRPDLVLLDIGMPALDGKAVMRIVSKMGDEAPTIVFSTALDGDQARAEGLAMGRRRLRHQAVRRRGPRRPRGRRARCLIRRRIRAAGC